MMNQEEDQEVPGLEQRDGEEMPNSSRMELSQQLHAICYRTSTYQLKLALKAECLFDSRSPLLVTQQDGEIMGDAHSIAKIPTHIVHSKPVAVHPHPEIIPITHPSVKLSPAFIHSVSDILLGFQWIPVSPLDNNCLLSHQSASPLLKAIQECFGLEISLGFADRELPGWELYENFLLFQTNAFQSKKFLKLLKEDDDADDDDQEHGTLRKKSSKFFDVVAKLFKVSHVARKGLISRTDVSRQPKLIPLHGRFREGGYNFENRQKSYDQIFWTSTRFNTPKGVIQYVWAPSETMYSRGNSKEKIRISQLKNVSGKLVVDMCCGIGFFSFGYLLAGASQVIACEISDWASEGLRRGAIANGFSYAFHDQNQSDCSKVQLLIFRGSNELALPIYRHKASHVNLGLLPNSTQFLPQSLQALCPEGGWLHIHGEITARGGPNARQKVANAWAEDLIKQVISLGRQSARVIDIHWVKSIGPAKEHLVVELEVGSL